MKRTGERKGREIKWCPMAGEEQKERKCADWVISLMWVELTLILILP